MNLYILDFQIKEVDLGSADYTEPISLKIQHEDAVSETKGETLRITITDLQNSTAFQMFLQAGDEILAAAVVTYEDLQADPLKIHFEPIVETSEGQRILVHLNVNLHQITQGLDCPYIETNQQDAKSNRTIADRPYYNADPFQYSSRITLIPDGPLNLAEQYDFDQFDYEILPDLTAAQVKQILYQLSRQIGSWLMELPNVQQWQEQLTQASDLRFEQQNKLKNDTDQINEEQSQAKLETLQYVSSLKASTDNLISQSNKESEKDLEADELLKEIGRLKRENLQLRSQRIKISDKFIVYEKQKHKFEETENLRKQFKEQLDRLTTKFESNIETLVQRNHDLDQEKLKVQQSFAQLQDANEDLQDDNQALKRQLQHQKQKIEFRFLNKINEISSGAKIYQSNRLQTFSLLDTLLSKMSTNHTNFTKNSEKYLKSGQKSSKSLTNSYNQIQKLTEDIQSRITFIKQNVNDTTMLEQYCCIQEDLHQLCEDLNGHKHQTTLAKRNLLKKFNQLLEILQKSSQDAISQAKKLDGIADGIEEKQFQSQELKSLIGDIRRRIPLYIPIKNDPIDEALAEYLNHRGGQTIVPFTREEPGVYKFGTKRVALKLERQNIKVRTGGGYNFIEEFLEMYTPQELLKLEQVIVKDSQIHKQVLQRFQSQPGQMSPLRAGRILASSDKLLTGTTGTSPARSPKKVKRSTATPVKKDVTPRRSTRTERRRPKK